MQKIILVPRKRMPQKENVRHLFVDLFHPSNNNKNGTPFFSEKYHEFLMKIVMYEYGRYGVFMEMSEAVDRFPEPGMTTTRRLPIK